MAPNPRPPQKGSTRRGTVARRWVRARRALAGGGWALLVIGVIAVALGAGVGTTSWTFTGLSLMLAGAVFLIVTGAPTWE